jgi:hypothetical protein
VGSGVAKKIRAPTSFIKMAANAANSANSPADQGRWLDFNTLFQSSCAALHANSADIQSKALNILFTLASNADENLRTEMGSGNLISDLNMLLSGSFAQEGSLRHQF